MAKRKKSDSTGMQGLGDILKDYDLDNKGKYISQEFQDYGYRLALEMDDDKRVSMYIKFAKTYDRKTLEEARTFIKDSKPRSKARLFMWKLKQLREEKDSKN